MRKTVKVFLIVAGVLAILAATVLLYFKLFAQPLDKTGMVFDLTSALNGI